MMVMVNGRAIGSCRRSPPASWRGSMVLRTRTRNTPPVASRLVVVIAAAMAVVGTVTVAVERRAPPGHGARSGLNCALHTLEHPSAARAVARSGRRSAASETHGTASSATAALVNNVALSHEVMAKLALAVQVSGLREPTASNHNRVNHNVAKARIILTALRWNSTTHGSRNVLGGLGVATSANARASTNHTSDCLDGTAHRVAEVMGMGASIERETRSVVETTVVVGAGAVSGLVQLGGNLAQLASQ